VTGKRRKYFLDKPTENLIQALYDGSSKRLDELEEKLPGIPRWKIMKWASEMGLAARREPLWEASEIDYLEGQMPQQSVGSIARHLGRTKAAVQEKAKMLGLNKCSEGYTISALSQGLGCQENKVRRWIENGWISGKRRGSERAGIQGDFWLFRDSDVVKFVRNHPQEIDLRRVDKYWFIDLLLTGR
jgi:hypothetical protein